MKINQAIIVTFLIVLLIGCGGNSFTESSTNTLPETNTTDITPPTTPTLVTPENNTTIFDTNVTIQISGEINTTIYMDGIDLGIDLNESGRSEIVIALSTTNTLLEHNITLIDRAGNESDPLQFFITRLAQPQLISPNSNSTTFANSVDLNISGGVGSSIFVDNVDTLKDINETTGFGQITIALETYETKTFSITLKDNFNHTSTPLSFTITRVFDTEAAKQIKVIEMGYIKDANVTGVDDKLAIYSDSNNTYTFTNPPAYTLSSVGGIVKDLNLLVDINMTTGVGTVISPITTMIDRNVNMQTRFATIFALTSSAENFAKDYIATNDLNFTKIATISYIALKYPNITSTFISQTATNTAVDSINGYGAKLKTVINSSDLDLFQRYFSNQLIDNAINFEHNATDMASEMKPLRYAIDGNRTLLPKRVTLKTNQTICFDKANPTNQIACTDGNASGDGNTSHRFGEIRNFERNTTTNIVIDYTSKLEWQDDNGVNTTKSWADAKQYCLDLNISGKDDWYLPSIEQLNSIVDRNSTGQTLLDPIFTNNTNTAYWSQTSYAPISNNYRTMLFSNGVTSYNTTGSELYVRCVRDLE